MRRYFVKVQHGEYSKEISVLADENEEMDVVKTKARQKFFRDFGSPFCLASSGEKILSWEDID